MSTETNGGGDEKSRKLKKTIFAVTIGGVAGFLGAMGVLQLSDSGVLGDLNASREIAALVAVIYLLTGGSIAVGLANPKAGAAFLNVEDADELREQKSMLGSSAIGMAAAGFALMLVAFAGANGPVDPGAALIGYFALAVVAVFASLRSWKVQDELMRAVGREAGAMAYYLILLVGGTWALLAHLEYLPAPAPLDWLTMFWALMLLASFIVIGRRGMLEMR